MTLIVFAFFANVSAQLEISSSGQVGIGTKDPQHQLDIDGDARVAGNIYMRGTFNSFNTTNNVPITFKVNSTIE